MDNARQYSWTNTMSFQRTLTESYVLHPVGIACQNLNQKRRFLQFYFSDTSIIISKDWIWPRKHLVYFSTLEFKKHTDGCRQLFLCCYILNFTRMVKVPFKVTISTYRYKYCFQATVQKAIPIHFFNKSEHWSLAFRKGGNITLLPIHTRELQILSIAWLNKEYMSVCFELF